jgi:hypothetical protein
LDLGASVDNLLSYDEVLIEAAHAIGASEP